MRRARPQQHLRLARGHLPAVAAPCPLARVEHHEHLRLQDVGKVLPELRVHDRQVLGHRHGQIVLRPLEALGPLALGDAAEHGGCEAVVRLCGPLSVSRRRSLIPR